MSRGGKLLVAFLVGFLLALGAPAAAATAWQDTVLQVSLVAVLLVLAYEGAMAVVAGVAAGPLEQRVRQFSNAVDRAMGRRLSRYARQYRAYVRTRQRFIDSKGLATVGDRVPELDRVFVDVGLAPRPPHQVPAGVLADVPPDISQRYSIYDFLSRAEPRVLAVLGAPGSGKTTLLRHVARSATEPSSRRHRRLPILLTLRDHAGRITGVPGLWLPELQRTSLPELPVREPEGWWDEQLQQGRCVVLLDGLDEVARAGDRRAVADWIERQIGAYPGNDFVITSRPHGYRAAMIGPATVLQVRPFTDQQVHRFLHGWYRATERHATGTAGPDIEARAAERAADLIERLASAPALDELAANPLLLTMIALVHRHRSALPAGRADLYGEICQVMLWRRQEAKRLPVDLPGSGKERVLAHLAFTMLRQRVRDLSRPVVLETVLPVLRRVSTEITAEAFLADVESTGLLVERERDLYAFAHHTIAEYLTARYIREHGLSQVLAEAVSDAWWRETTLLYVADADADPVIRASLDDGTIGALSLAFECIHHGGAVDPELRARLDAIRDDAFREGTDPERRRLVASVLAARHLGQLVSTTDGGGRVCPQPVSTELYWLFSRDTGAPVPDGMAGQPASPDRPALGLWAQDAVAFTAWVNTIVASSGDRNTRYRLPTCQEVQHFTAGPAGAPAAGRAGIWTRQPGPGHRPRLWRAGPDPGAVSTAELREAATWDAVRSPLLLELLLVSASVLDQAMDIDPVAAELPATVGWRRQVFPVAIARDLDLAHTLTHYQDFQLGREHAIDLADVLGLGGTFDITRARDRARLNLLGYRPVADDGAPHADHLPARARFPGPDVARALADALGLEFAPSQARHRIRDLALGVRQQARAGGTRHPVDLVRETAMGSALAAALAAIHERRDPKHRRISIQPLAETFATTLVARAGFQDSQPLTVTPEALPDVLRGAIAGFPGTAVQRGSWAAVAIRRLMATAEPVFTRQRSLHVVEPVMIRAPALALAGEANRRGRPAVGAAFRTIAAGVTLLQRRVADPQALETAILART